MGGGGGRAGMFVDTMCLLVFSRDTPSTGVTVEGKTPKTLVEEIVTLLDSPEVMYVTRMITFCKS